MAQPLHAARYALAFDTSNEVIAIGVGLIDSDRETIVPVVCAEARAHRASNTQLLPRIDALLSEQDIAREDIACVACGRGPGSFTGVRIAMATAKGVAQALGVGLIGVSTLDAVAWGAQDAGVRGALLVAADAMRQGSVSGALPAPDVDGVRRLEADRVVKAAEVPAACADGLAAGVSSEEAERVPRFVTGDALAKYEEILAPLGELLPQTLWEQPGAGFCLRCRLPGAPARRDPFDAACHNPAFALPVYTRLSDAEENERIRLAKNDPKNLRTGVQDVGVRRDQRATCTTAPS